MAKATPPPKRAATKAPSKAPKAPTSRRGTPKGKGVVAGKGGNGRIGNPQFKPTDEHRAKVEIAAAVGAPHWLIAREIKIDENTLRKYFRSELDNGLLSINATIGGLVARQALAGDKSSQALWLKSRAGWSDKLLLSSPDGEPLLISAQPRNPDLEKLSDEEIESYLRLQAKVEGIELIEGIVEP